MANLYHQNLLTADVMTSTRFLVVFLALTACTSCAHGLQRHSPKQTLTALKKTNSVISRIPKCTILPFQPSRGITVLYYLVYSHTHLIFDNKINLPVSFCSLIRSVPVLFVPCITFYALRLFLVEDRPRSDVKESWHVVTQE